MKFPSIKFSLPKIGFLERFQKKKGKKSGDSDDALDEEDLDEVSEEEDAAEGPEGDELEDDELEDGESEAVPAGLSRKKLILIAAVAVPLILGTLGGVAWVILSGGEPEMVAGAEKPQNMDAGPQAIQNKTKRLISPLPGPEGVPRVIASLPPKSSTGVFMPEGDTAVIEGGIGQQSPEQGLVVPPATPASFAAIAGVPAAEPLTIAPAEGLFEEGSHGMLPRVAADGRMPWKVYAKPHVMASDIPSIAIIVRGLGLSRAVTDAAVRKLPANVTLAFDPYGQGISDWVQFSRQRGHETLITLPMEPREFPIFDPGPYALRSLAPPEDNIRILEYVLGQTVGYVGVMSSMGSKFSQNAEQMEPILGVLKARGLMFVDGSNTDDSKAPAIADRFSLPRAMVDITLDRTLSKAAIEANLAAAEGIARSQVVAVVAIDPTPAAIEAVALWALTLEGKNLSLAPVSALANKQILK